MVIILELSKIQITSTSNRKLKMVTITSIKIRNHEITTNHNHKLETQEIEKVNIINFRKNSAQLRSPIGYSYTLVALTTYRTKLLG